MKLLGQFSLFLRCRCVLVLAVLIIAMLQATAQQAISGKITDADNGDALIGVSIMVQGTTTGTISDADGQYNLNITADAATLVLSYVGYKSKEVALNGQAILDIQLEVDAAQLEEVIVIGYGQQRKADLTTAVATLSAKDIKDQPVNSFDQALIGKLAGVQVLQPSGSPGAGVSIRVRGTGSITAGNEPLYVIDGVPVSNDNNRATGQNPGNSYSEQPINVLSTLNPADIESIQVLKDASAAAIYGSRGSNGVVLITTKKGKAGKPTTA